MSNSARKSKGKQPRNKRSLAEHYEEIGIKAVAAAVQFRNSKSPRPTREEERSNRIRDMGRGE